MAAPNVRMRLTVEILPLAEENARGPHQASAIAAFKESKFALPVQLEDTFEQVWNRIEQRYKTNYLNAAQAAAFTIKKLQDAYDCDLDLRDTVSSIFEGETNPAMRIIKVVPAYIDRAFSVPPTSYLRPAQSSKRHADFNAEHANKRRRIEAQQLENIQEEREASPDSPIQSTETDHEEEDNTGGAGAGTHLDRSRSGDSLVFVHNAQTGDAEFTAAIIKAEPTDTELPPLKHTSTQPLEPASQSQAPNRRSKSPLAPSQETSGQQPAENIPEATNAPTGDAHMSETAQNTQQVAASPDVDSQEAAVQKSPVSSLEQIAATPPPAATKRRDVYDVPSSPEFMQSKPTPAKNGKTYGRSPRTPKVVQSEVDLLNKARLLSAKAQQGKTKPTPTSSSKKARSFQLPRPDEIESTPQEAAASNSKRTSQPESDNENDGDDLTASFLDNNNNNGDMPNGTQTPVKKNTSKPARPGSLKKAPMKSLLATPATPASPATAKRGAKRETAKGPSVNTRARKQLDAKNEVATPPGSSNTKRNTMGKDTPARMRYLKQLLESSQSTPASRLSEGSPSLTKKNKETPTPLPVSEQPSIETPKPTEPVAETPRPLVPSQSPALKATPVRSPVPLPANVAHLASNTVVAPETEASSSKNDAVFKKPALRARSTLNGSPVERRATRSESSDQRSTPLRSEVSLPDAIAQIPEPDVDTPTRQLSTPSDSKRTRIRSEVPLPANVQHLRSSNTPQKQPDSTSVPSKTNTTAEVQPTVEPANGVSSPAKATPVAERTATKPLEPTPATEPTEDTIVISSRESSSTNYSDSLEEQPEPTTHSVDGAAETRVPQAEQHNGPAHNGDAIIPEIDADEGYGEEDEPATDNPPAGAQPVVADQQNQTTESQPTPWNTQSWGFGKIGQQDGTSGNNEENPDSEDEAANETERKSRSASVVSSIRSSPTVSRQPARFLSHSPTPDASESDDASEDASGAPSKAASAEPTNDNEESDSSSSSDSSDDEDVEMPDLPAESTTDSNANAAPPSSPPLNAIKSTPIVPESSQPNQLPHKTPIPLPSSQAPPHSSQSVSAQAAERRRYTGFRSLREQLAETRAPKPATQTKTFDPRTMSLNKLAKGKPLVAFGGDDDESSDEESSSSSDSDSD